MRQNLSTNGLPITTDTRRRPRVDGILLGSLAATAGALGVVLLVAIDAPLRFVPLLPSFVVAGLLSRAAPRRPAPQIALAALVAVTIYAVVVLVTA